MAEGVGIAGLKQRSGGASPPVAKGLHLQGSSTGLQTALRRGKLGGGDVSKPERPRMRSSPPAGLGPPERCLSGSCGRVKPGMPLRGVAGGDSTLGAEANQAGSDVAFRVFAEQRAQGYLPRSPAAVDQLVLLVAFDLRVGHDILAVDLELPLRGLFLDANVTFIARVEVRLAGCSS